jgi:hypothetical protein
MRAKVVVVVPDRPVIDRTTRRSRVDRGQRDRLDPIGMIATGVLTGPAIEWIARLSNAVRKIAPGRRPARGARTGIGHRTGAPDAGRRPGHTTTAAGARGTDRERTEPARSTRPMRTARWPPRLGSRMTRS